MSTQSQALVCNEAGKPFALENICIQQDALGSNQAIVNFKASGICHTDTSTWLGLFPVAFPIILGHEGAGQITHLPSSYSGSNLQVGDTVLCSFTSCNNCSECKSSHPAGCHTFLPINFGGIASDFKPVESTTGEDGKKITSFFFGQSSFARHGVVDTRALVKVDPSLPVELVCSFGCGIQTGFGTVLNKLLPSPSRNFSHLPDLISLNLPSTYSQDLPRQTKNDTLVIFGLGAVGFGGLVAGRLAKIHTIICVDLVPSRLEIAKKYGATHTVDARLSSEDVISKIKEYSVGGNGADMALEAAGHPVALKNALQSLTFSGRIAAVGAAANGVNVELEMADILAKSLTYSGVLEGDSLPELFIPYMLALFKRGDFDIMKELVKTYRPEEMAEAMADAKSGKTIKPVIVWE